MVHPDKFRSELVLERGPGNEMGLTAWYPVEALCEPGVEVQSHGRMREASKRPFVERYGVFLQAGEVFVAQEERCGLRVSLTVGAFDASRRLWEAL